MLCPECQQRTQVLESRLDAKTIRRRRRCPAGHTFNTIEVLLEAKSKPAPKPKPKPKQKHKPRKRVLYPRPAPQPTYRDELMDDDFDSFDVKDLGLD